MVLTFWVSVVTVAHIVRLYIALHANRPIGYPPVEMSVKKSYFNQLFLV